MVSVVICTCNRSESLIRTLKSLRAMLVPDDLRWELLVIDNNSKDDTKQAVEDFAKTSKLGIRYVFEEKQGLSRARNSGVREAKGEIIAFTDDDVIVDEYWLANMVRGFKEHDVAAIGGRIFPVLERPKPKWVTQDLQGCWGILDYGERPFYLNSKNIWGANLAIRADMFRKYGGFDTSLGRVPGKLYAGEETDFVRKLMDGGEKLLYWPTAVVHHFVPKHRSSKKYIRRWNFDQGEMNAIRQGGYTGRNLLGIPYYMIGQLLKNIPPCVLHTVSFSRDSLMYQSKIGYLLGFILGTIRYHDDT